MQTPLQLSFKNMDRSDYVEGLVRERVDRLEQFNGAITSCHVHVEAPHKRHNLGNHYEVRIEVQVPGSTLAVSNRPGDDNAHEEVHVAIRDAFDAMERQLKRRRQKASGEVKAHEGPMQGRIAEIDHEKGFGQIIAADGQLVYFHQNSVTDGEFRNLKQRDPVELVVQSEESDLGPQASTVRPINEARFGG